MADYEGLGAELVGIMKDGLRAQGWMDPAQVQKLKEQQDSELIDDVTKIEDLEVKIEQQRVVLKETHDQLFEAYNQGSLSARGCATIAARIKDELHLTD